MLEGQLIERGDPLAQRRGKDPAVPPVHEGARGLHAEDGFVELVLAEGVESPPAAQVAEPGILGELLQLLALQVGALPVEEEAAVDALRAGSPGVEPVAGSEAHCAQHAAASSCLTTTDVLAYQLLLH